MLPLVERTQQPGVPTAASVQSRQPTAIREPDALLLAGHAERAGMSVDPRYGVRDDGLALQVVPTDDGL